MNLMEPTAAPTGQPSWTIDRIEGDLMAVNSYLVHGPAGIVVVDGQLTVADAGKVGAAVAETGKPLAGLLVTHPHPDHYAGAALIAPDAPIYATPGVDAVMRRDDALKAQIVGAMMGEQWPEHRRFPDELVLPGTTVELGGLHFRVSDSGPGESDSDTLWWLDDRTVFIGDVAYSGMHSYLADGHYEPWLAALTRLQQQVPADATLYVGHGEPVGPAVLTAQQAYVTAFLDAVAAHGDDDPDRREVAVVERMRAVCSDERLLFLMQLSIEPAHLALTASR